MVQIRMPASTGRAYYDKKIAEGKILATPPARSNGTSPDTSGASCSPTKTTPPESLRKQRQTPLDK
jgi:hypothetical protein